MLNNFFMPIGYKVVNTTYDIIRSYSAWGRILEYKCNTWTYPREDDGPIAIFDTYRHALKFLTIDTGTVINNKIYECEYESSKYTSLWYYHCSCYMNNRGPIEYKGLPKGTILANKVKLTKLMEID